MNPDFLKGLGAARWQELRWRECRAVQVIRQAKLAGRTQRVLLLSDLGVVVVGHLMPIVRIRTKRKKNGEVGKAWAERGAKRHQHRQRGSGPYEEEPRLSCPLQKRLRKRLSFVQYCLIVQSATE